MQFSTLSVYIYVLEDIENCHFSKLCVLVLVPNFLVLFIYNIYCFLHSCGTYEKYQP